LKNFNLCSKNARLLFNPGNGKLNVFDYNYELDTKSMDVLNSPIPLVFAGYEPSSYTHIGNIDLASLDRSEADKWLFDVVQRMEKTRSILLEDLFL
jgi:pyrimidine-specific ribonucleoside hydrolase